jgi:hypothetical protein
MKVKRSLESRIRGWIPKEPVLGSALTKSKAYHNKEMVSPARISTGLFSVVGGTLLGFSLYVYLVDPHAWGLAWVINIFFIAVGIISISISIFVWLKDRKQGRVSSITPF